MAASSTPPPRVTRAACDCAAHYPNCAVKERQTVLGEVLGEHRKAQSLRFSQSAIRRVRNSVSDKKKWIRKREERQHWILITDSSLLGWRHSGLPWTCRLLFICSFCVTGLPMLYCSAPNSESTLKTRNASERHLDVVDDGLESLTRWRGISEWNVKIGQAWWCMPVITAPLEAEPGGWGSEAGGAKVQVLIWKKKKKAKGLGVCLEEYSRSRVQSPVLQKKKKLNVKIKKTSHKEGKEKRRKRNTPA
jgi:hypothetical protein